MTDDPGRLYEFVFRGQLTDAALDRSGRLPRFAVDEGMEDIAAALSLELLEQEYVDPARRMAVVYTAIAAFENSVRHFISKVLLDAHGEKWWELTVSENIRKAADSRRDDEQRAKWHGLRGAHPLNYTELGHLVNIMQQSWVDFEPYVRRIDWATSIFGALERSRNVIMHSGTLDIEDVERVGIHMRDWIKQVGL